MNQFFQPLENELNLIPQTGGLRIEKQYRFMPIITECCCDLPAKCEVQGIVNHNGYNSCGYCDHPGFPVKSTENSKSFIRYTNRNEPTHQHFLDVYKKCKTFNELMSGIKYVSCLAGAAHFDLVNGFCIDYMHCVLLGVQRKFLDLWLASTHHKMDYHIKPKMQICLSQRLIKIKPTSDIARKPRAICD